MKTKRRKPVTQLFWDNEQQVRLQYLEKLCILMTL